MILKRWSNSNWTVVWTVKWILKEQRAKGEWIANNKSIKLLACKNIFFSKKTKNKQKQSKNKKKKTKTWENIKAKMTLGRWDLTLAMDEHT